MEPSRWTFSPRRVLFEQGATGYDLGRRLWEQFSQGPAEVRTIPSHNRVTGLPGRTPAEAYREAKRTLVVGVRRGLDFASCRPSADYQMPLVTSCPGLCEYCYLQTTLGPRPYVRVYVNVDEVLAKAGELTRAKSSPERMRPVYFEGAAVGDPVPVEPLTGSLARAVRFFAATEDARFRFVTKFPDIDDLLGLNHRGHTRARVTVNTEKVIKAYDHGTPGLETRLQTLGRLAAAGYPIGAMVAPVFLEDGWRDDYATLFRRLGETLGAHATDRDHPGGLDDHAGPDDPDYPFTLEVVSHRFTPRARKVITERHPGTTLPMTDEGRRLKRGQFGYFKYVYPKEALEEARSFLAELARTHLPGARLDYVV